MFTWICPQCGREVPPAYDECPDCAAKAKGQAPAAAEGQAVPPPATAAPTPAVAVAPSAVPAGAPPAPPIMPKSAPPAPPAAAAKPSTAHTLGLSVLFALAFVGLGAGIYWLVNYVRDRGQTSQQTAMPLENPATKGKAKPHPLQRYIEVTGVRFIQDAKKKTEARFLVVNHSPDDITDLGGNVTIWGRTQKSDEESVGTFSFKLADLGPYAAKELAAPMNTKLRVYELPDWQNVTAEVQLTSP